MSNPAPDSSLCKAAAPRLRPLQLLLSICVRFSCCSPIASASAAAHCLCPLQLLLPIMSTSTAPQLLPLWQLLSDCVRFNCCSPIASASTAARPIASASTAAPRLHASAQAGFQPMPGHNVLEHSSRSSRFSKLKYEVARHYYSPAPQTSHFRHAQTDRQTHTHTLKS